KKEEATVIFIGDDRADDPAGLLYYLMRVFPDTSRRSVRIHAQPPAAALAWESDRSIPLVIVTAETTTPENVRRLRSYVSGGGTLVYVATRAGRAQTLAALTDDSPWVIEAADTPREVLLSARAFDH